MDAPTLECRVGARVRGLSLPVFLTSQTLPAGWHFALGVEPAALDAAAAAMLDVYAPRPPPDNNALAHPAATTVGDGYSSPAPAAAAAEERSCK